MRESFQRALEGFAAVVIQRRGLVLVLVFLVWIAALSQLPRLRADFSPQDLFTTFEAEQEIAERFKQTFGHTENVLLFVVDAPDVYAHDALRTVHALSREAQQLAHVEHVSSLTVTPFAESVSGGTVRVGPLVEGDTVDANEADAVRRVASTSRVARRRLVDATGRTAVVAVQLDAEASRIGTLAPLVRRAEAMASELASDDVSVSVAGLPHIRVSVVDRFRTDQMVLLPLSLLAALLILWFSFRWWAAVLLPGAAVVVSASLTLAAMAIVGEPVNIINQAVPILVIIIGVADSVHLVNRYRDERAIHDADEASRNTLRAMTVACLMTSVTTAVGFVSLVASGTGILRHFGVTAGAGVMFAYVVTVVLVPAALASVALRRSRRGKSSRLARTADSDTERWLGSLAVWCARHRGAIVVVWLVIVLGAIWLVREVRIDTRLLEAFEPDDEIHRMTTRLEEALGGVLPLELSLYAERDGRFDDPEVLNALERLVHEIQDERAVLDVMSYPIFLREAWGAYLGEDVETGRPFESARQVAALASLVENEPDGPVRRYVTLSRDRARVEVRVADVGAVATVALAGRIRAAFESEFDAIAGVELEITGDAYLGSTGLRALIGDLAASLGLAAFVIFLIIGAVFRSVRLMFISLAPNLIPLLLTGAWMALRGIELNTTTVIIFSIGVGLAVDDTIHLLARYAEELRAGERPLRALRASIMGAGRAVLVTSAVLGAGLAVLQTSTFVPLQLFGELLLVTIVGCVIADLTLLPALLAIGQPSDDTGMR